MTSAMRRKSVEGRREMDVEALERVIWIWGVVFVYGLVRWVMMAATHDLRVRAGVEAVMLSRNKDVPETTRSIFRLLVERAYSPFVPWLLVLGVMLACLLAWRRRKQREAMLRWTRTDLGQEAMRVKGRLFVVALSTSPLASIVCVVLLTVILLFSMSIDRLREWVLAEYAMALPGRFGSA